VSGTWLLTSGLLACSTGGKLAGTSAITPAQAQPTVSNQAGPSAATATRHGWRLVVRPVTLEAGPSGLLISVTVPGPLVVRERACAAPLSVWLVDRSSGRRVRSSFGPVRPKGAPCSTGPRLLPIRKGVVRTFTAVIPFPIPAGSYTVRGLLTTAIKPAGAALPTVEISWP
jgi:hypothetical protein